jgi:hypothetical protein
LKAAWRRCSCSILSSEPELATESWVIRKWSGTMLLGKRVYHLMNGALHQRLRTPEE